MYYSFVLLPALMCLFVWKLKSGKNTISFPSICIYYTITAILLTLANYHSQTDAAFQATE